MAVKKNYASFTTETGGSLADSSQFLL